MASPSSLSDEELRTELQQLGFNSAPVTESTRSVLEKKLLKLRSGSGSTGHVSRSASTASNHSQQSTGKRSPGRPRKYPKPEGDSSMSFTLPSANVTPPTSPPIRQSPSPRRASSRAR